MASNQRMPDFLIIGAAKSSTTSLYFFLQQHPKVYMPVVKEPFFFTFMGQDMNQFHYEGPMKAKQTTITDLAEYQKLFLTAPADSRSGEASTLYLYDKDTPAHIKQHIPEVKMIAILRNPIDRAYSHFQHFRRDRLEPLSNFRQAILDEPRRMRENWFMSYFYVDAGFYGRQIKNYLEFFPKNQLKVFLYEDMSDPQKLVREIFKFIEVEDSVPLATDATFNRSGQVRFRWLYQLIKDSTKLKPAIRSLIPVKQWNWMKNHWDKLILKHYDPISEEDHAYLSGIYKEDISSLQDLIGRDLSHWTKQ